MRTALFIALFCSTFNLFGQQSTASRSVVPERVRELQQYADRAGALGFSGEVLVAQRGRILLQRDYGYADATHQRLNDTATFFYLASLSKQYTAAAILKLIECGKLSLDSQLATLLANVPDDKRPITVRQLLTHTSGLGNLGWDDIRGDWKVMTRDEALTAILRSPLSYSPGTKFSYTNTDYVVLAAVVEAVAYERFQDFVATELLRPAGVRGTVFGATAASLPHIANGYSGDIARGSYLDRPRSWLRVGPADALATVSDFYRWFRALQTDAVLSAGLRSQMFSVQEAVQPGYGYGFGWWVREDAQHRPRVIFHAGDFPGFHSEARWYPADDLTVVVASNDEFRGASITEAFINGVVAVLSGKPDPLPDVRNVPAGLVPANATYCAGSESCLRVSRGANGLHVEAVGQPVLDMIFGVDATGTQARDADGVRTRDLVLDLKHRGPAAYNAVLAQDVKNDAEAFAREWTDIVELSGELRSVQLLGTLAAGKRSRTFVRLNFDRRSTLMSFEWSEGRLEGTEPSAAPRIEPLRFTRSTDGSYVAFDWNDAKILHLSVDGTRLSLTSASGKAMTFSLRQEPNQRASATAR
jgi:CubicO group peptidase (beta-lactamase class C family)